MSQKGGKRSLPTWMSLLVHATFGGMVPRTGATNRRAMLWVRVRARLAAATLLLMSSGGAALAQEGSVTYRCDELVVRGRVTTVSYASLGQASGTLPGWQGVYSMQVRIKRLLRGKELRAIVPVASVAHAQLRDDADLWLVLTPRGDGGYSIRTGNLWRFKPKLATACD
jgi:hypothetical protein